MLILKKRVKSSILFLLNSVPLYLTKSVLLTQLTLLTENSWANCHFSKEDILQIIRNLDSNKTHDQDMISIHILKPFGDSIQKLLVLDTVFKTYLRNGKFSLGGKQTKRFTFAYF